MARLIGQLRHRKTGKVVKVYEGFSWTCLFFWFLWPLSKGMWGWAIVSGVTCYLGWFIFPFFANERYRNYLFKHGYVADGKLDLIETPKVERMIKCPFCAESIKVEAKICRFCGKELAPQSTVRLNSTDALQRLKKQSPAQFEEFVLEFLKKVEDSNIGKVTGQTGDEGIDGYIKLGKSGLVDVSFQAKRWDANPVGRPDIQQFVGALHGKKVAHGVFVTTSTFTKGAQEYVEGLETKVRLIDGEGIIRLLDENNLWYLLGESSEAIINNGPFQTGGLITEPSNMIFNVLNKIEQKIGVKNGETLYATITSLPRWVWIVLIVIVLAGLKSCNSYHSQHHKVVKSNSSN